MTLEDEGLMYRPEKQKEQESYQEKSLSQLVYQEPTVSYIGEQQIKDLEKSSAPRQLTTEETEKLKQYDWNHYHTTGKLRKKSQTMEKNIEISHTSAREKISILETLAPIASTTFAVVKYLPRFYIYPTTERNDLKKIDDVFPWGFAGAMFGTIVNGLVLAAAGIANHYYPIIKPENHKALLALSAFIPFITNTISAIYEAGRISVEDSLRRIRKNDLNQSD
ncbi:hypothetical protein KW787_01115 [Candidatus Pacearchaeota archaeon]|nr:hypothetical protein [Candidatus Pacearchaeota archaeon]